MSPAPANDLIAPEPAVGIEEIQKQAAILIEDKADDRRAAEPASESPAASLATAPAQPVPAGPRRFVSVLNLLVVPVRVMVSVLVALDMPLAFLGPFVKTLIGGAAIVTAIMATATWIAGPRLASAIEQGWLSSETPPQQTAAAEGSRHSSNAHESSSRSAPSRSH